MDTPSPPETPFTRTELHFRRIDMRGFQRSDGLFEVEGRVVDQKTQDFMAIASDRFVPAGGPVHDMGVRIVFDETLTVRDITSFTDGAPYGICMLGGQALQALKGLRMTSGWGKEVRSRIGGARSCTNLMELLVPLATVAFQALSFVRRDRPDSRDSAGRALKIDSCFAYAAGRDVVRKRWPEYYRPQATPVSDETPAT